MVSAASAPLISEHVADAAALAHVHLREGHVETCVLPDGEVGSAAISWAVPFEPRLVNGARRIADR